MQDKGYLLVNVQLPDAASLERTERVMRRHRPDRQPQSGRRAHRGHRRPIDPLGRQRAELRRDVHHAQGLPRPHRQGALGRRDLPPVAAAVPNRDSGRFGQHLRRPAVDGLGTAGGFKIIVEDRGDHPLRDLQNTAEKIVARGRTVPPTQGPLQQLPRRHPLALPRHRPRPGEDDGRFDDRNLQHAAGLSRLALRQRLQPLRPHLAGERPGRRRSTAIAKTS